MNLLKTVEHMTTDQNHKIDKLSGETDNNDVQSSTCVQQGDTAGVAKIFQESIRNNPNILNP